MESPNEDVSLDVLKRETSKSEKVRQETTQTATYSKQG